MPAGLTRWNEKENWRKQPKTPQWKANTNDKAINKVNARQYQQGGRRRAINGQRRCVAPGDSQVRIAI
jgi:hypothetical protein